MTDTPTPNVTQQTHILETLGPRGLSTKQQTDIATIQGQVSRHPCAKQRRRQRSGTSNSLYVGELDPSVDEALLLTVFSKAGSVESIYVCRDAITNQSLGYAYIRFVTNGEETLDTQADHTLVNGKPCRLMWMSNGDRRKPSTSSNIFIKNLDAAVTTKSLLDTFSLYGNITNCKIVTDERGRSKGYGFIRYDTTESAERAINTVNGMTLYDRNIFVGHYIPKQERIQRMEETKQRFTNVYVKNLVADITEEELQELFGGFGPIASVLIQRDDHGHSRGFGFVNFERHEDAERAVLQMHATEYIGKRLFVSRAQKRSEREEDLRRQHPPSPSPQQQHLQQASKYHGVNIYIKNLADAVDDDLLKDIFTPFGAITSAKVMREDKTCQSKGFGFVCFHTPQEANEAVVEMNGATIMGKTIYVALAQKKEDRRHHLETQLSNQRTPRSLVHVQTQIVPTNSYLNGAPLYYDPYPPHSYPSHPSLSTPKPIRWNHATPPSQPISSPSNPTHPTASKQGQRQQQPPLSTEQLMDALADHSQDTQKLLLGERMHKAVGAELVRQAVPNHADVASKVTGMLLEMDVDSLVDLVKDPQLLNEKTREAVALLDRRRMDGM